MNQKQKIKIKMLTPDEWSIYVLLSAYSDMNIGEFCNIYNLDKNTFEFWRKELSPQIFQEDDCFDEEEEKSTENIVQEELQEELATEARLKAWSAKFRENKSKSYKRDIQYLL